jgi:hypothetical protein
MSGLSLLAATALLLGLEGEIDEPTRVAFFVFLLLLSFSAPTIVDARAMLWVLTHSGDTKNIDS